MTAQPTPVSEANLPTDGTPVASVVRTPEQKAQAKALKKERKQERLRFFFGWCQGCQAFGSGF
ncbi:MAG: hypothetical protein JWR44_776 [Hymenobacter sp.]|jgi:hypothetical protein|nr:hypothetical protein [Hymenobacter sp.]